MKYEKEEIIKEIQRVASKLNVHSLTQSQFEHNKISKFSISTIRYHFGSWNEAIKEAGLNPIDPTEFIKNLPRTIPDDDLLQELLRLYKEYGKEPTQSLVNAKSRFSTKPYADRWGNIPNAFLLVKKYYPTEFNKSKIEKENEQSLNNDSIIIPPTIKTNNQKKRIIFGEPIDFRGLRFAPVNEQGVVYLFGMISRELGFLIESIRTEYPDCEGKRLFDKNTNQWEHVRIELEFRSHNFKEHNHNPDLTDLIVCWIHDWEDCPLEVLELKSVIKYLKG